MNVMFNKIIVDSLDLSESMAEASISRSESRDEPDADQSNQSSDDWDYRSRSSSADDSTTVQTNLLFMERQASYDTQSMSLDLSYLNLDSGSCGENISQFANALSTINLSGNRLDIIPPQLINFSANLQMLDLSHNQLKIVDDSICELKTLRTFICADNQLDENSLPKDFGQTFANNLRVLSFGGNLVSS